MTVARSRAPLYQHWLGGTRRWWWPVLAIAALHAATLMALPLTILLLGGQLAALPIVAGFALEVLRSAVRRRLRRQVRASFLSEAGLQALDKRTLAAEAGVDSAFWTAQLTEYAITVDLPAVMAAGFAGACILWLASPTIGVAGMGWLLGLLVSLLGLAVWSNRRRAPGVDAVLASRQQAAGWIAAAERDCGEIYGAAARAPFLAKLTTSVEAWSASEDLLDRKQLHHRLLLGAVFFSGLLAILRVQGVDPLSFELSRSLSAHHASSLVFLGTGIPVAYVFATHADSLLTAHFSLQQLDASPSLARGSPQALQQRPARLLARELSFSYSPSRIALVGIDFDVDLRRIAIIVGPNGTGKTTLATLICGVLMPNAGELLIDGLSCSDVSRDDFAFVPQTPLIVDSLSIQENVRLVAPHASASAISSQLRGLGLERPLADLAGQLSRGEQRRLAIARAILKEPRLLVLDEPDTWLDGDGRAMLAKVLERELASRAIVVVSHRRDWLSNDASVIDLSSRQAPTGATGDASVGRSSACG